MAGGKKEEKAKRVVSIVREKGEVKIKLVEGEIDKDLNRFG